MILPNEIRRCGRLKICATSVWLVLAESTAMKRVATLILALVSSALAAAEFQVLTGREYHLRSGTNAEWESFAASKPYGRRLDLEFTARSNAAPHTLLIAQDEVQLGDNKRGNVTCLAH